MKPKSTISANFKSFSETELKLEKIREKVAKTCDSLGRPIDSNIRETVAIFWAFGLPTSSSCGGHLERRLIPYIEVSAPNRPQERFIGENKAFKKVAQKYGITVPEAKASKISDAYWEALKECSKNGETEEYKEWQRQNNKLRAKIKRLLEEFYKGRKVEADQRLKIEEGGDYLRVRSGSGTVLPFLKETSSFSEKGKKEFSEQLTKYRAEMKKFTEFLKEKYLQS